VTLQVVDTGPGMPPDVLAQVFEPLFSTKARGIGLGLAVSRSLAEANAGSIIAASVPGRGATFTLTVPATASREPR
jgi:signal transduction histidine kinase